MLLAINTIMIIILIAVVTTNIVLLFQFRDNVKRRMDEIDTSVTTSVDTARLAVATAAVASQNSNRTTPILTPASILTSAPTPILTPASAMAPAPSTKEQRPSSFNLLDHDEFSKINPELKDIYKEYIVQGVMPRVMNKLNKEVLTPDTIKALRTHGQEIASMDDATFFGSSQPASIPVSK